MNCPFHFKTTIGWMADARGGAAFLPPERISMRGQKTSLAKKCPAIHDFNKNRFLIRAPFDIHLSVRDGVIHSVECPVGAVELVRVQQKETWNDPEKPIVQINLPYRFVSDQKSVRIRVTPPFDFYTDRPGVMISGEFDCYDWPLRNINFGFEWHDTASDLIIKRGEPLLCVEFFGVRSTSLTEMFSTPALESIIRKIAGVVDIASETRGIMKAFGTRRPKKVVPLGRL